MPRNHLGQPAKARRRPFLRDQQGRVDRARRIVERDHQVVLPLVAGPPGKARGILVQHHADHRPPRPLLAVRRAPGRWLDQPGTVQRQPGHRVAELVVVPLHQLLVKMLHRKPAVALLVQTQHALDLLHRGAPARRLADPPVDQPRRTLVAPPIAPAAKGPLRDPQHLGRLLLAQITSLMPLQQPLKPHLPYPLQHLRPDHPPPPFRAVLKPDRPRDAKTGQITSQLHLPIKHLPRMSAQDSLQHWAVGCRGWRKEMEVHRANGFGRPFR